MNLPARVEYACIAVLELAVQFNSGEPVRLRSIADAHGIPSSFLVQILLQLKAAGLVESTRGASGGYQLTRDPADITLAEVKEIVEGPAANLVSNLADATSATRILLDAWKRIAEAERDLLAEVTFGQLVERVQERPEKMYYI